MSPTAPGYNDVRRFPGRGVIAAAAVISQGVVRVLAAWTVRVPSWQPLSAEEYISVRLSVRRCKTAGLKVKRLQASETQRPTASHAFHLSAPLSPQDL